MNFNKDYQAFIDWEKAKGGAAGPTKFTAEEDVSIRLFVAYLNCRYAKTHLTSVIHSVGEDQCECQHHEISFKAGSNYCQSCGKLLRAAQLNRTPQ